MRRTSAQRRGFACAMSALALAAGLLVPTRAARGDELLVAAAADLTSALAEVSAGFEKRTGHRLRPVFGSSGNFFAQIRNGAPFDVFLSADLDYPRQLEAEGLAEPGSLCRYATGRIVLWVPADSSLAIERLGLKALLDPSVVKVAIANPQHAPYGRAAAAALRAAGCYEKVEPKLVLGENVSQAAQFVASGNASAGIIALSLALAPAMRARGRYWLIQAEAHPPLDQAAVILKTSAHKPAARALLKYLESAEGRALLERYGFEEPKGQL